MNSFPLSIYNKELQQMVLDGNHVFMILADEHNYYVDQDVLPRPLLKACLAPKSK